MSVLLIGGAGYIGGAITDLLLEEGHKNITVVDSLIYEDRYLKKGIKFINKDAYDFLDYVEDYNLVINLAAIVGDGACTVNADKTDRINLSFVKELTLKLNRYQHLIHFSSCSVYGINDNLLDESSGVNPLSLYADTKIKSEEIIKKSGRTSTIVRLGTVYGVGDSHSRLRFDLVANTLVAGAYYNKEISVFGGDQFRPLIHVKDVARAVIHLSKVLPSPFDGEIYNVSSQNTRICDLARQVRAHFNDCKINESDIPFEDKRNYKVLNTKLLSTGFKPKYTVDDGINELKELFDSGAIKDWTNPIYHNHKYLKSINF